MTLTLTLTTPTQGAYQLEACICQPGYYGVDNTCAVCADGAECPGGNLMRARAGWCEVKNSEPGVASLFRHCCKPDLCPGGVAAVCDGSTALVGVDDCAEAYDLNRDPRRDLSGVNAHKRSIGKLFRPHVGYEANVELKFQIWEAEGPAIYKICQACQP